MSPYDMRNAILRCPFFLIPILSSVSLGIECSSFRAGQSPFSQPDTSAVHANPYTEDCSRTLWHEGYLRSSRWTGCGYVGLPTNVLKAFLCSCTTFRLQHGQSPVSNAEKPWSRQRTNGSDFWSCSSLESLTFEISNKIGKGYGESWTKQPVIARKSHWVTPARLIYFLEGNFKLSCIFRDWGNSLQRNSHSSFVFSVQKKLCKFESWNAGWIQGWITGTEKPSEIGPQLWSRHMTCLEASPNFDVGRAGSESYT